MGGVTRISSFRRDGAELDLEALRDLEAALGRGGRELIDDGVLEATGRLVEVEQILREGDWIRAARAARGLGRAARRLGMAPLADQAEALEDCCICLDEVAARAVGARLLRTGEAMLSERLFRPSVG